MHAENDFPPDEPAAAGAHWARRLADGMSPNEKRAFQTWMAADPRHPRALAAANRDGSDCDWAWQAGATDEVLARLSDRARRRIRRRTVLSAVAAVAVLLAIAGLGRGTGRNFDAAGPAAPNLMVASPARRILPDGSVVELKPGARITADFTGPVRAVSLLGGTAHFEVTKDPLRPFVVRAGELAVRAVGTAFMVDLAARDLTVLVTEGSVRVDPAGAETAPAAPPAEPIVSLGAMQSASFAHVRTPTRPVVRQLSVDGAAEQVAWRIPRIEFSATPLREVVAQINRHNRRQFVLGDAAIGNLRVSGILRADKVEELAEMLETDFGAHVVRSPEEIVLRTSK